MTPLRHLPAALILLAGLTAAPAPVHAETFNTCTGFIASLPATISTQGTWCLSQDLTTAIIIGNAITIDTNNVTIDCNGFKLGGLAAGVATQTYGIYALDRLNATVRHCNIRGFHIGVNLQGTTGGGHVVEDNRIDGNTHAGLFVVGDGSVVQRNLVHNTGGATVNTGFAYGIETAFSIDVLDNTVSGVLPILGGGGFGHAYGISTINNFNGSISGNRVRKLVPLGFGLARGIDIFGAGRISLDGNHIIGDASVGSIGLRCTIGGSDSTKDNIISGFASGISVCGDDDGNVIKP